MKLLKKLIPLTSILATATCTGALASCSKKEEIDMHDLYASFEPSIEKIAPATLTPDQALNKYVDEIKSNPDIWEEDIICSLRMFMPLSTSNANNYFRVGVTTPKISKTIYNDGITTPKEYPSFSFKIKVDRLNANTMDPRTTMEERQTFEIDFDNVILVPTIIGSYYTFALGDTKIVSWQSFAYQACNTEPWSISISYDFTRKQYQVDEVGKRRITTSSEWKEDNINITSVSAIATFTEWFQSRLANMDYSEQQIIMLSKILFNLCLVPNVSYHMTNINIAPDMICYPLIHGETETGYKETLLRLFLIQNYNQSFTDFRIRIFENLSFTSLDGSRTITIPAGSQLTGPDGGVCSAQGELNKAYETVPTDGYDTFVIDKKEVKVVYEFKREEGGQTYEIKKTVPFITDKLYLEIYTKN